MPKTKTRRKSERGSASYTQTSRSAAPLSRDTTKTGQTAVRRAPMSSGPTPMSLVMAAMVTLGCWGMAISFILFSADPNRYLFGGMAILMGLMWAVSFGLRLRKMLQQR
ncbi:MAG TPA: hypothetical protein VFB60_18965 [Ktedonobacteraceae bacterium]|nr:hypothetical protein [Ktedonobacteraceae bacterium]